MSQVNTPDGMVEDTADDMVGGTQTPPAAPVSPARAIVFALLGVAALVALVSALLPSIGGFQKLLPEMEHIRAGFLIAAIACQGLMYVGVSGILRAGVIGAQSDHPGETTDAPVEKVTLSVIDPRFVGGSAAFLWCNRALPGPAVAGLAALVFVLGRRGVKAAAAQAAAATFYLADYVSFAIVSLVLLVALLLRGQLVGLNVSLLGIAMGAILLSMAATILLLRSPRLVGNLAEKAAGKIARVLRRRDQDAAAFVASARGLVDGFYERWTRVAAHPTALVSACVWGIFMHVAEIATIFCALMAFGVNPEDSTAPGMSFYTLTLLLIASGASYVTGNLAAIISFLPAGLGAFEVAMGATLHIVGFVSLPQSALATLLYRLLSVWLPLPFIFQTARQALRSAAQTLRAAKKTS